MRMSLASAKRQPCSIGSCIDGDEEASVRAERHVEMRALPGECLRRGLRVRKPERHAAVVRDRDAQALRREREPAGARRQVERFHLALGVAHEGLLAGRPCHRAVRPERDAIDPAVLRVGRKRLDRSGRICRDDLAVIAAGDDAIAVGHGRQNAATMNLNALLAAVRRHEQQRLLAEHEGSATFRGNARPRPARRPQPASRDRRSTECCSAGRTRDQNAAIVLSKPLRIFSSGRLRPMNTTRLVRFSSARHSR